MKNKYTVHDFLSEYHLLEGGKRILNAGSASKRYGEHCVNVDIQAKPNVDVVCDIHDLPDSIGKFDAVICNAVLQYCRRPDIVAQQFKKVLTPGGLIFVEAPWVQPFCPDSPDRFRFSQDALRQVFSEFEILSIGPTVRSGTALAMEAKYIAQNMTGNKYINYGLYLMTSALFYPFMWISTQNESITAGAFYLIGQKLMNT